MKSFYRTCVRVFCRGAGVIFFCGIVLGVRAQVTGEQAAENPKSEEIAKVSVIADRLNVRSGPSTSHEILGQLQRGDVLPLRGTEGDWISFSLPASMPVWIHKDFVQGDQVIGDRVNLRAGPSTRYTRVGTMVRGDKIQKQEESGDWMKIQPPASVLGWVHKDFVVQVKDGTAATEPASSAGADAPAAEGSPSGPGGESNTVVVLGVPAGGSDGPQAGGTESVPVVEESAADQTTSEEETAPLLLDMVPSAGGPAQGAGTVESAAVVPTPAAKVEPTPVPVVPAAVQDVVEEVKSAPAGVGALFPPIDEGDAGESSEGVASAGEDSHRFVSSAAREDAGVPEGLEQIDLKASPLSWPTLHEFRLLGNPAQIQGRLKKAPIQNIPNLFILEKQYGTGWYPDCFVVGPKIDLTKYVGREIRVKGKRLFVEDWTRPLLQAEEVATTWK